ncbi:aspartate dehydrogenase [Meridianimarinicoccus sp. RP-17]|uniref:aspartate dehydrogenase n=1 Tax=Meridianimarinicoccus zhengii TaxID=2056810 RepID=UPI000DAB81BE|nr:aspartate dehydrogenase [Phycocomes zhengii]
MNFAIIGQGAIAQYVMRRLVERGHRVGALVLRPERAAHMKRASPDDPVPVTAARDLPPGIAHVIDCAGHSGLAAHGPDMLRAGYDMTTVSLGALAEQALADRLAQAAIEGNSRLHLASGAIGALDCLSAARIGSLAAVRYVGRKPPRGWLGSPADDSLDLLSMGETPQTHFKGSAREAATRYPKNANVAAAVALAGLGFDATEVELIADPTVSRNIHEIHAEGDFGSFQFRIEGNALPDNPRSSALAAMSAVQTAERAAAPIVI